MIVWMRHQVVSKNSSIVYLTTLAINDLVFLLFGLCLQLHICPDNYMHLPLAGWICHVFLYVIYVNAFLEPLLVLAFSVERLIAILHPLQVCCMCVDFYYMLKIINSRVYSVVQKTGPAHIL